MPRSRQRDAPDSLGHTGRRVACKTCRQAKMRCELSAGGRVPCARCRRMDRECRIDTEFKRVNKQEKLEELENELRQLRSSISAVPVVSGQLPEAIIPDDHSLNNSQGSITINSRETELGHDPFQTSLPSVSSSETPKLSPSDHLVQKPLSGKSLDGLRLDASKIHKLFLIFFNYYHPHLPFLTPTTPSDEYYEKSPLRFWTMMYIASRRYVQEPDLVVSLMPSVKKLLWECIANPPHTLELVQSILLVCVWTFPTSSITTDNTITLITTAHVIATRLGLHRPEAIKDFSRTNRRLSQHETAECLKTWAACHIAFQGVTAIDGQIPAFSDWTVDRLCIKDSSEVLPDSIYQQLRIYRFEARTASSINGLPKIADGVPRSGETLSLLTLFEQEFVELGNSFGDKLTEENSILLDATGLHLYVFYLMEPSGSDIRKRGLLRAFNLATSMIQKFSVVAEKPHFTDCAPQLYFHFAAMGAMVILKIAFSNYSPFIDCEEGKRMFHLATQLIRRMSLEDNDLPGRMSKILTQLWSAYARMGPIDEEPTLKLRTRHAASLLHDILWCWRETFGGQGNANNSNNSTANSSVSHTAFNTDSPFETVPQSEFMPPNLNDEYGFGTLAFEELLGYELMPLFPLNLDGSSLITN